MGFNSDLLSSDLAPHISGRYVSFKIISFIVSKVCEFLNILDISAMEKNTNWQI